MVWRRALAIAAAAAAAALAASGCGGEDEPTLFRLQPTLECLRDDDIPATTSRLDFVASTAPGGALRAPLGLNEFVIVFGNNRREAVALEDAYERFGTDRPGVQDRLVRARNVVLVWAGPPSPEELDRVSECLKG
jgi:hypothetical protein